MWVGIITLFPEIFQSLDYGVTGRALRNNIVKLTFFNPRNYTQDKHQQVDDKPYGGGPGMLMKTEPMAQAITAAKQASPNPATTPVIYLSPQGQSFSQQIAEQVTSQNQAIILIAGRYEGVDQRIIDHYIDHEWSIGDFILTGGELPAALILDVIIRLLPGVVGDQQSIMLDSLTSGLLKHPQYTRPEKFEQQHVPAILLSGHHQAIDEWRLQQSLAKTWLKRPDLLIKRGLSKKEALLLTDYLSNKIEVKTKD